MTEYWISKKQYWCKYCNIWIRDDAPSRRQHETGLKHQGNRERFIRELYKGGDRAKREKAAEAAEMARIESSAAAAYAHDTHTTAPPRQSTLSRLAASSSVASSSRARDSTPKDKWANYSTAKQLGFDDEETNKSSYEIEQMVRGRAGEVGAWQTVEEPLPARPQPGWEDSGGKRKLGEYVLGEEEDGENFKFQHRDKRPVNDVWNDDDRDPRRALGGLRVRVKEERRFEERRNGGDEMDGGDASFPDRDQNVDGGLKREEWSGRLDLRGDEGGARGTLKEKDGLVYIPNGGGWVKADLDENGTASEEHTEGTGEERNSGEVIAIDKEPPNQSERRELGQTDTNGQALIEASAIDVKPDLSPSATPVAASLFKKRRPPPGTRKT